MLRYALFSLQLAHAVGECILRRGGSDVLFPNDVGRTCLCGQIMSNLTIFSRDDADARCRLDISGFR